MANGVFDGTGLNEQGHASPRDRLQIVAKMCERERGGTRVKTTASSLSSRVLFGLLPFCVRYQQWQRFQWTLRPSGAILRPFVTLNVTNQV